MREILKLEIYLKLLPAFNFIAINTPSPGYVAKCAFKTCPAVETAILGQMRSNLDRVPYWYCLSAGNSKIGNILETCAAFEYNCNQYTIARVCRKMRF